MQATDREAVGKGGSLLCVVWTDMLGSILSFLPDGVRTCPETQFCRKGTGFSPYIEKRRWHGL